MSSALLSMDFINEIVHPDGKLSGKGYADFVETNDTLENMAGAVEAARSADIPVIYVKVGFSPDYSEQLEDSPLFGKADEYEALQLGTWATEFHDQLDVRDEDSVVTKHRVSPFCGTPLDLYLRQQDVKDVYLGGVATDLVVQSAARDAHDRGYRVGVLSDCCAAANDEDHQNSLKTLEKIAEVGSWEDLLPTG